MVGVNAVAGDQTVVGAGNERAMKLAAQSPLVASAMGMLKGRLSQFQSKDIRKNLAELMGMDKSCVTHRANLSAEDKGRLLAELDKAGLIDPAEATRL